MPMKLIRAAILATALVLGGGAALAQSCGKLCDQEFWSNSSESEILSKIYQSDVNARDEYGYTPLHLAAKHGTPENIQALINVGADVEARTSLKFVFYGWFTPLHFAAASETPDRKSVV